MVVDMPMSSECMVSDWHQHFGQKNWIACPSQIKLAEWEENGPIDHLDASRKFFFFHSFVLYSMQELFICVNANAFGWWEYVCMYCILVYLTQFDSYFALISRHPVTQHYTSWLFYAISSSMPLIHFFPYSAPSVADSHAVCVSDTPTSVKLPAWKTMQH